MKVTNMFNFFKKYLLLNYDYKQTIIKNIFWNTVGNLYRSGIMFLMTIALARLLGTVQYGVYTFALSLVSLFTMILDFGFSTVALRDISDGEANAQKMISNLVSLRVISGFLMLLVLFIVSLFLGKPSQTNYIIYLLAVYIIADSFSSIFSTLFLAKEKMEYDALAKIITSTILFVSTFIILYVTHSIILASISMAICALISVAIFWIIGNKHFDKITFLFDKKTLIYFLKKGYFFGLSGFLGLVNLNFVSVVLGFYVSDSSLGGFGATYKVLLLIVFMSTVVFYPIFPVLSRNKDNKSMLVDINKKIILILVPICIFVIIIFLIFKQQLVQLILGKQYVEYAYLLNYLLFISLFFTLREPAGYTLNAVGLEKKYFIALLYSAIVNVVLCLVLIPKFGLTGAAIACLASEFVTFVLLIYFFWKYVYKLR
jgi:O-antigen/teichoic acid export membrane protein